MRCLLERKPKKLSFLKTRFWLFLLFCFVLILFCFVFCLGLLCFSFYFLILLHPRKLWPKLGCKFASFAFLVYYVWLYFPRSEHKKPQDIGSLLAWFAFLGKCFQWIFSEVFGHIFWEVFGGKSSATVFVCQPLTLISASFFGLYEMACVFKARINP